MGVHLGQGSARINRNPALLTIAKILLVLSLKLSYYCYMSTKQEKCEVVDVQGFGFSNSLPYKYCRTHKTEPKDCPKPPTRVTSVSAIYSYQFAVNEWAAKNRPATSVAVGDKVVGKPGTTTAKAFGTTTLEVTAYFGSQAEVKAPWMSAVVNINELEIVT